MERERWISRRDQASGDRALANSADSESTSIEIEREREHINEKVEKAGESTTTGKAERKARRSKKEGE